MTEKEVWVYFAAAGIKEYLVKHHSWKGAIASTCELADYLVCEWKNRYENDSSTNKRPNTRVPPNR